LFAIADPFRIYSSGSGFDRGLRHDRHVGGLAEQRPRIYLNGVEAGQDALDRSAIERARCDSMVGKEAFNVLMHAPVVLARGHR
jgi:hypothetical protein